MVAEQRKQCDDFPPEEAVEDPRAVETPWINLLMRGLRHETTMECRWRQTRHINLLEVTMVKKALEYSFRRWGPDVRIPLGVDSLVACGVCNKGRSASRALNAEWRKAMGWELCCGVRAGLHYVPSRLNPSDHPSRSRRVPPPTADRKITLEAALETARKDNMHSTRATKQETLWHEIILKLRFRRRLALRRGGKKELPAEGLVQFDANGLEGDGPQKSRTPMEKMKMTALKARICKGHGGAGFPEKLASICEQMDMVKPIGAAMMYEKTAKIGLHGDGAIEGIPAVNRPFTEVIGEGEIKTMEKTKALNKSARAKQARGGGGKVLDCSLDASPLNDPCVTLAEVGGIPPTVQLPQRNMKRPMVNLLVDRGLRAKTINRRQMMLNRLHDWLVIRCGFALVALWAMEPQVVDLALATTDRPATTPTSAYMISARP